MSEAKTLADKLATIDAITAKIKAAFDARYCLIKAD